ncbi:GNAT family N-acetyltransferase [Methylocystis sp. WRRC1]|uniref:GNAT family N-acetyltransferase n=1 Tax=Methylocystis sp. WRRC1 TaxID=1732014 RepID=UPI001D14ADD1|nr:GNAT family N-acetyltransferase [Methylocystis sp. WRRC1]MCC3247150.1 GNAT family N-acetyltransferase [Methylocystis sp. WRRC1]
MTYLHSVQSPEGAFAPARYECGWTTAGELAREKAAWRKLADEAIEPNPVYCSNVLVAAERHLRAGRPIPLLIVRDCARGGALAGVFPLEERGWRNGFPGRALSLFVNPFTSLTHPLIRRDDALVVLGEAVRYLARAGHGSLLFPFLTEKRGFYAALDEAARREGLALSRVERWSRPAVEPEVGKGGDFYARNYVSKSRRSSGERRLRRLQEIGAVEFPSLFVDEPGGREAFQAFLQMERDSWKGKAGTALLCRQATRDFAQEAFSGADHAPSARIRSLTLDGRPIAMALDLESQGVVYAFKAAYDQTYAHFSPGLMLDAHTAAHIGENDEIKRLDSFAQTEIAQAAVWRQEEPILRSVLALSPQAYRTEALARRLRIATATRNRVKYFVRRSREIASLGANVASGRKWSIVLLALAAGAPVVSTVVTHLR